LLFAALAAFSAALSVPAARAEGAILLPPGKESGETRSVRLPGGAELTLSWVGAGTVKAGGQDNPVRMAVDGFWIGVCEVTQKQWESVMGGNPSYFRGGNLPVECVSWEDCMEFCRRTGLRLPTETEWLRAFYVSCFRVPRSWTAGNSGTRTHPVPRADEEDGIFDLAGNVGEWCADWFAPLPTARARNYAGPATGTERVVCGGNWCGDDLFYLPEQGHRLSLPPACRYNNVGFRVCLSPVPDGR
jgi:formylglycine-generating enzyme required for sulfatase activity